MRYVALLRAINVGGRNKVNMKELKHALEELGFQLVQTYLQSGNVVFEHQQTEALALQLQLEQKIQQVFGCQIRVLVKDHDTFEKLVSANPFLGRTDINEEQLHVTFLFLEPDQKLVNQLVLKKAENEACEIIGSEVYLYCPDGYGNSKLSNPMLEKKLGVATTRNWRTTIKLLAMLNED